MKNQLHHRRKQGEYHPCRPCGKKTPGHMQWSGKTHIKSKQGSGVGPKVKLSFNPQIHHPGLKSNGCGNPGQDTGGNPAQRIAEISYTAKGSLKDVTHGGNRIFPLPEDEEAADNHNGGK